MRDEFETQSFVHRASPPFVWAFACAPLSFYSCVSTCARTRPSPHPCVHARLHMHAHLSASGVGRLIRLHSVSGAMLQCVRVTHASLRMNARTQRRPRQRQVRSSHPRDMSSSHLFQAQQQQQQQQQQLQQYNMLHQHPDQLKSHSFIQHHQNMQQVRVGSC
jgi:hypothetical protein